ncbi:MAG: hypothetical protein KAH38_10045, partial [Candidatus Hydrogenedentes bacterium]|nr:hypothetical protein [Candidatus Hydrogenedentota bacterium]
MNKLTGEEQNFIISAYRAGYEMGHEDSGERRYENTVEDAEAWLTDATNKVNTVTLFIPDVDFLNPEVCNHKYTDKFYSPTQCALSKKGRGMAREKLVCAGIRCEKCICDITNKIELGEHIEELKKDKKPLFIPDINYLDTCFHDNVTHCTLDYLGEYLVPKICKNILCAEC